jgi:hypothetical protein
MSLEGTFGSFDRAIGALCMAYANLALWALELITIGTEDILENCYDVPAHDGLLVLQD